MKLIVCIYFWIWIDFINVLVYYEDKKLLFCYLFENLVRCLVVNKGSYRFLFFD